MSTSSQIKFKKGIFCISIDTELLWGRHDLYYQPFISKARKERRIIKQLLNLFQKYEVSATWGVVGHLFLDNCKKQNKISHPDIVRPKFRWVERDWFKEDPNTSLKLNPDWYGTDIIKLILKYKNQEIGSHSFSHIIFGDPGCSVKCADSELKKCVSLAKKIDLKLNSFIFPRNSIGHLEVLKKNGFKVFRGPDDYPFNSKGVLGKILMLIDLLLLIPHASNPKHNSGLLEIPGNMYFLSSRGWRRYLPKKIRIWKAKLGIRKAIKDKKVFHLWFHPTDLTDDSEKMISSLKEILSYAAKEVKKGNLELKNMGAIRQIVT